MEDREGTDQHGCHRNRRPSRKQDDEAVLEQIHAILILEHQASLKGITNIVAGAAQKASSRGLHALKTCSKAHCSSLVPSLGAHCELPVIWKISISGSVLARRSRPSRVKGVPSLFVLGIEIDAPAEASVVGIEITWQSPLQSRSSHGQKLITSGIAIHQENEQIERRILLIRGPKVLLDADPARL